MNGLAELGEDCTLAHVVTIGETKRGERKGCPKIGNRVWIGAGAVIVGKIVVGDNVLIAPNAYVNFDVPSNSIVMGTRPLSAITSMRLTVTLVIRTPRQTRK